MNSYLSLRRSDLIFLTIVSMLLFFPIVSFSDTNNTPTTPTNLIGKAISPIQVNLRWSPSIDVIEVSGYEIYRDGKSIGRSVSPLFSDLGLKPETEYEYSVVAYNSDNKFSEHSNSATIKTLANSTVSNNKNPDISDINIVDITSSDATITWTSEKETVSQLEYGTSYPYELTARTNNEFNLEHKATITGAAPGTTYRFKIKSKDRAGKETVSDEHSFSTLSPYNPNSSSGFNGQSSGNNFSPNNNYPSNNGIPQGDTGNQQLGCAFIRDLSNEKGMSNKNIILNSFIILSPLVIIGLLRRLNNPGLVLQKN